MTALERLNRWDGKHYTYELQSYSCTHAGPTKHITLKGGNRSVTVDDTNDFQGWDGESDDIVNNSLTLEEMINLAIDRWHECLTPRMHKVYLTVFEEYYSTDDLPVGFVYRCDKSYSWEGMAKGEMDAITIASDLIDTGGKTFVNEILGVLEIYVKQ